MASPPASRDDADRELRAITFDICDRRGPSFLSRFEPRPPIGQLTTVDGLSRLISHVTCNLMKLTVRQFLASYVGQKALRLNSCFIEAAEHVAKLVTIEAAVVTNIEKVPRHDALPALGEGAIPQALRALGLMQ